MRGVSRDAVMAILGDKKKFYPGSFGRGHMKAVGATKSKDAFDFRSNRGVVGRGSLEVMINSTNSRGYADVDRFNFYGGLAPATAHIFGELAVNKLRRLFGRK